MVEYCLPAGLVPFPGKNQDTPQGSGSIKYKWWKYKKDQDVLCYWLPLQVKSINYEILQIHKKIII